jgi:hypothetical protein
MSIAVSDLRTRIRKITRRDNIADLSNDDLDVLILESCREIAKRCLCLKSETTGTLTADGTSITAPSDMVDSQSAIENFYLSSGVLDPISFDEWRAGKIKGYHYRNGTIYVTPTSDNDRSYTLYYRKIHGALSTNLEFEDDLKMAVAWLTCKKVYDNYENYDQAVIARNNYELEMSTNAPCEPMISRMRLTRE